MKIVKKRILATLLASLFVVGLIGSENVIQASSHIAIPYHSSGSRIDEGTQTDEPKETKTKVVDVGTQTDVPKVTHIVSRPVAPKETKPKVDKPYVVIPPSTETKNSIEINLVKRGRVGKTGEFSIENIGYLISILGISFGLSKKQKH